MRISDCSSDVCSSDLTIAGLATVTPASGFVGSLGGILLGLAGGILCFLAVDLIKHRWRIDDSLDVLAVHGVGGATGTLLVAVLAVLPESGRASCRERVCQYV